VPPKEELLKPFENVSSFWYRRKRVTLEWQIFGEYGLFSRPHNAEHEFLWSHAMFTTPREDEQEYVTEFLSRRYLHSYVRWLLFSYGRDEDEVWLRPHHSRAAFGLVRQGSNRGTNWKVLFDWKGDHASFASAPLEFFVQSANSAIEDKPELWQRSLEWTHLSSDARFWSCVSWKAGNREEWKALMRALFQLVLSRLPLDASHHWAPFRLIHPRFAFAPLRMSHGPLQKDFPETVWPLLALADHYFGAVIDYSHKIASAKGPFVALFIPGNIKALHPTQHELIEALNLWRDFGRKSGQMSQVEACLKQLLT
jgi:hypothetical protein